LEKYSEIVFDISFLFKAVYFYKSFPKTKPLLLQYKLKECVLSGPTPNSCVNSYVTPASWECEDARKIAVGNQTFSQVGALMV